MERVLVLSLISVIGWGYYFYQRKKTLKKDLDGMTKFWELGLDFKFLVIIIFTTILSIYFLIEYIKEM